MEALFEASDSESEDFSAALADRKTELLRFCKALTELAGTDSSATSLLVAQTTYSYPKLEALAALSEVVEALRAYLHPLGAACNTASSQADVPEKPCMQATAEGQPLVMDIDGQAGNAQSNDSPASGLQAAVAGDMQHLILKQSCANSDVDLLNTPTSQSQQALLTRLRVACRDPWVEPDPNPADLGNHRAAGHEAIAQPGDGGMALQPADLTESQLLVPDSYPSGMAADLAHPVLVGNGPDKPQREAQSVTHAETQYQDVLTTDGPNEPQPEAQHVVQAETQYQDAVQDEEMPEKQLSSEWREPDQEAEEVDGMEEDGMEAQNQENSSLHSNSQALAADSQAKKGSQEDNSRGSASQERPQNAPLHGMPGEAQAELQELDVDVGLKGTRANAKADAAEYSGHVSVEAHEDPADAEALHGAGVEVVADAEEDFQDAQAIPSTDAESDGGSSESDYDSPSWHGSGEDLLLGSEQQDKAAKIQSERQVSSFST